MGDEGAARNELVQAGLPIFTEFVGLFQCFPLQRFPILDVGQVVFRRLDVIIPRILQGAVVEFGNGDEADGIGLVIGQDDGQGREILGETAQRFVLVKVIDLHVLLRYQFRFCFFLAASFLDCRIERGDDGGAEDGRDNRRRYMDE